MGKSTFNYGKAAAILGKGVFVGGLMSIPVILVGMFGYVIVTDANEQHEREAERQKLVEEVPLVSTVTGPGQSTVTRGGLTYIFDFESGIVFIDTGTEQTDRDINEFDNQDLVKQVKTQGCATPEGQPRLAAFICQ